MSDEIDLQLYINAVLKRWWLVLLSVIIALVIAFLLGRMQPKTYVTDARLTVETPRYQWRFDPSIQNQTGVRRELQTRFMDIGNNEETADRAGEILSASWQSVPPAEELLDSVRVTTGDAGKVIVVATSDSPEKAAELTNAWAAGLIEIVQERFGPAADLASFQSEMASAREQVSQTEDIVLQVRGETGLFAAGESPDEREDFNIHQRQAALKNQRLAEYLNDLDSLRYLSSLLAASSSGEDISALPWELLSGPVLSERGIITPEITKTLVADPEALAALLGREEASLKATADQLAAEARAAQLQLAEDWRAYANALRPYNVARNTFFHLANKADEADVQARLDPGQLVLTQAAIAPETATATRQLAQYALAAVLGFIVGVLLALWLEFRGSARKSTEQRDQPAATA
ncbi:MAG: Wzz/FepE/Etk N-terminal domain-containing protein [Chloroflexota bacterium]|nr:Wzz/FepE/Etk N-terminal domain-containing protein [Chloroflexota bacterium]